VGGEQLGFDLGSSSARATVVLPAEELPGPARGLSELVHLPLPLPHLGFGCDYCEAFPCQGGAKLVQSRWDPRQQRILCRSHGHVALKDFHIPWLPKLERNFVGRELQWTAVPVFEERPHGELVFSPDPRTGETLVRRRRWSQA
jgi:hypothetical protein